jgi:hypothetical protein
MTPARSGAKAWAVWFLALTLVIHVLTIYFLFTLWTRTRMIPAAQQKEIAIPVLIVLSALFFWHYTIKKNGLRVISSFQKQGNDSRYARVGAIMFAETMLLPMTLVCLIILWNKLKN